MQNHLISIVMPARNAQNTIEQSIQSVLQQTYSEFELLICNDGSTDSTKDIINSFKDTRIRMLNNVASLGAAAARNACLRESMGRYVAFLDSDDIWAPSKLETQLEFMLSNNVAFSYGSYNIFTERKITGTFTPPKKISFNHLCKKCDIGCLTVMIDISLTGKFEMPNICKEDYATWLSIMKNNIIGFKYPGIHASYRTGESSLSSNKLHEIKRQFKVLRNVGKLSILRATGCVFYYTINGLYKHFIAYKRK
ncbi:glycosyltransferase family 2 protein [Paraglaciecola hydrolytica]|uniref:Glycosyltransferase 2-like domain-containing protein n=1 Tax=Paraglaciecola hydrolytica TaxID=1799789 RepID=A0A135ZYX2_9ALTE|nr:glycosyltransferase family 2 protein [Paraglaciecola hydrolytica]KXI28157.1 hypothetical protein AX660_17410 [Paraglaciecola hydrolytica]